MKRFTVLLMVLLMPILFLACSNGGGSDTATPTPEPAAESATALTVADKVSVVDAKLTGSVAGVAPLHMSFSAVASDLTATSDYRTDRTNVWVAERAAESFNTINSILCSIGQTKFNDMLNLGDYVALVDNTQCDTGKSDASSAGQDSQNQSSSSDMPEYETFTVNASRADNSSPEIVKVWVHEKANAQHNEPEKLILAKVTITESKTDTNPYGIFVMNFLGHPSTDGVPDLTTVMFKGTLKSERDADGKVLLKFVESDTMEGRSGSQQITLDRLGDGTSGTGTIAETRVEIISGNTTTFTKGFDLAFSTANFYRKDDGNHEVCLDRTSFIETAWRYGLYDSTGERVNRNSGFSVNTKADGSGSYGFIGYWGLWLDRNASIIDNKLYKFDYSTNTATPYTVLTAGGKLKKHTRQAMTLGEVKGIPLNYFEMSGPTGTNYQAVWDGTNFNKTAYMPQNCTSNCSWQNITTSPTPTINVASLQWGELNFWSQSLGGQIRVKLGACTQNAPVFPNPPTVTCPAPTDANAVVFYAEDIIYPNTAPTSTLECYDNCPKATVAGMDPNDMYVSNMYSGPSNTPSSYTFDSATMLLKYDGLYSAVLTTTSASQQWGFNSGPLYDPAAVDATTGNTYEELLDCNWDHDNDPATNPQVCGWKAWSELPVFYTWETGPNNWNQFTALQDITSSVTLTFQPPLSVKYVHQDPTGSTASGFDGATFMMDYSGFGNLNGIPGKCVSMDTGTAVDCSTSGSNKAIRWVPAFLIPPTRNDGSLTTVLADGTNYFVKPLELEQRMVPVPTASCSALTLTHYTLPDISLWTDPAIGTEPTVTDPPAVIGGVVQ